MNENMVASDHCRQFLRLKEDDRLIAYKDGGGVWTIGCGHTGPEVHHGMEITQEQSDDLLSKDMAVAAGIIKKAVLVALSQNQFDALVSFVFNVGAGRSDAPGRPGKSGFVTLRNGNPSSALRLLNHGDYEGCADAFLSWCYDNGVKVRGLLTRREQERSMFLGQA